MDAVLMRDLLLSLIALTNLTILVIISYGIRVMVDSVNKLSLHFGAMTNDPRLKPMLSYAEKDVKLSAEIYKSALQSMKDYGANTSSTKAVEPIILSTRQEADQVLKMLNELVKNYRIAMLTDLYDLVGHESVFEDHKWGWDDLSNASVTAFEDMWKLDLPPLKTLDELQAAETVNQLNSEEEHDTH